METEEKRKIIKENSRLYAAIMDDIDAIKNVDNAIREQKTKDKVNSEINIQSAFKELQFGLNSIYEEHINLGEEYNSLEFNLERELIENRVEALRQIIDDVYQAYQKWSKLGLDVNKAITKKKSSNRIKKGTKTPESAFIKPILETLQAMGGSGKVGDILEQVYLRMKDDFRPADFEVIESVNEERWRNTAKWARKRLKDDGLLKANSPRGFWETSIDG